MSTTADNVTESTAPADGHRQSDGPADRFMRRVLRLPEGKTSTAQEARSAFQKSIAITACRCIVMYLVLPFVLPVVGLASGVGPAIGLTIGILAIISIIYSIRRFWRADHSKRWHYTAFATVIIGSLIYLSVRDIIDLTS
ncbi:MAG: ABC-type iron transport system FetAB permease component [Ilumatobacter sp.]|jgi:ABC-type iron transport system FetAB permease component